ncbi:hypothetical protein [Micromonospora sp. RTGN7]|uniref:hypothetical protein n=1 Tax=Micromonospora sp. RTGN7 TaxID=3016526 RepID=UPI0029FF1153|nr:hypothetical protein [Micromonospora sp. RTGN7]
MPGRALLRPTAVVLVVALAASGCTSTTSSTESTASTTVTGAPDDAAAAPGAAATTNAPGAGATGGGTKDSGAPGGGAKGGGAPGGGATGGGAKGGGAPGGGSQSGTKSGGPTIAYFRVADKPTCPAGTNVSPIAGTPVLVEWKVSNVDSVALSIDGPGVYADGYPSAGSEAFNFPCSGSGGDVQKHTYLLTVRNAHGTQTRTVVASATVHDIPTV